MSIMELICLLAYRSGLAQHRWPRWYRRLLAGTAVHQDWLAGHMGRRYEDGRYASVHDRPWYTSR